MTRKRWLPIAVLAAAALALGACGGDSGGGGTKEGDGKLTVFSLWGGSEQEAFQKVLNQFEKNTGIQVRYEAARDFLPVIRTRLAAGNPPEVAIIPRPGFVDELARDDNLISLDDLGLDADKINENYSSTWTDLAISDDVTYGVVAKANSKSLIWYKPNSFQENGFQIPTTWNELMEITKQYKAKGKNPWAVGAQGRDNSWTLTDWFENIYARQAGQDNYTKLFNGDLPFNDQTVKDALKTMTSVVNDQYVAGGIDAALGQTFVDGIGEVFSANPKAEMYMEGGFVGGIALGQVNKNLKIGQDIDSFEWPEIDSAQGNPLVGGGDVASAFVNDTDAAKLIDYLSTPDAGKIWVSTGAIVSPNNAVPDSAYPNELVKKEAEQVKNAKAFLFDGSDLLPGTLGQEFGTLLQQIIKNPANTDKLLDTYQAGAKLAFSQQ